MKYVSSQRPLGVAYGLFGDKSAVFWFGIRVISFILLKEVPRIAFHFPHGSLPSALSGIWMLTFMHVLLESNVAPCISHAPRVFGRHIWFVHWHFNLWIRFHCSGGAIRYIKRPWMHLIFTKQTWYSILDIQVYLWLYNCPFPYGFVCLETSALLICWINCWMICISGVQLFEYFQLPWAKGPGEAFRMISSPSSLPSVSIFKGLLL